MTTQRTSAAIKRMSSTKRANNTKRTNNTKRANNTVANLLRDRIHSGHYQAGDWLPTERNLAEDLSVDRRVVRTAINDLVSDGLVYRRPHCRPIVGPARSESAAKGAEQQPASAFSSSDFVALIMWPGGGVLEHIRTSQQRIFWGINQALAEAGYHAVFLGIEQIGTEEETAASEAAHLRYALERGFGGVILYPYAYRSNQALVEEVSRNIPLVTIDRRITSLETDFAGIDNRQAMFDTTMHLVAQGHRRIAYITKCEQIRPVQDRIQGYMDAVREAGLPEMILTIPSRDRDDPWVVTETIFRLPAEERPTAAAVFNDYSAVFLMQHLQNLGLTVPGDAAVTGFDDIIPALPNGVGLTTIAQPYEEIGRTAVSLLLRRMKNPSAPVAAIELPARLVVRESSAPPAA